MTEPIERRTLDFIVGEVLDLPGLLRLERFRDHSPETVAAILDTAYAIAADRFAPHSRKADEEEPRFEDGQVRLIPEVAEALRHFAQAGFLAATADPEEGGLRLPYLVHMAAGAVFTAANCTTMAYAVLTMAAANLIASFGTAEQKALYLPPMRSGAFFGTMALTEPQAGSSLADLRTTAVAAGDGSYRLTGSKIFISGGDHDLGSNIVHLVLARIAGAPPGVKGISLFLVPKWLVDTDGSLGARNDVELAGLIHKMGYRGTTSTLLNFGEKGGAVGYLIGEPNRGLSYMFQMMNEARIAVGNGAAALGNAAYRHSLAYARDRLQGRAADARDPAGPQIPIIGHPDVRRMLLAQKSYAEGALALTLYGAALVDEQAAAPTEKARAEARSLLDILTPIVKSWPSQWCLEANSLAIQIHGGYGYTREYPVEQIYRDNRLNPIHEGTHGIQGLDLLGRKVTADDGRGFALLCARIRETIAAAYAVPELVGFAAALDTATARAAQVTRLLREAMADGRAGPALGNASAYLEALGHVVVAWIWLRQGLAACRGLACGAGGDRAFYEGKLAACRYFFRWELPKTDLPFDRLAKLDDSWFAVAPDSL